MDDKRDKTEDTAKGDAIFKTGPLQVTIQEPWSSYLRAIAGQLKLTESEIGKIVERNVASSMAAAYALTQIFPDDPDKQIIPDLATIDGKLWPESTLDLYTMLLDSMIKTGKADAAMVEDAFISQLAPEGMIS